MLICCAAAILAAVAQTAQKCIGSHGENILNCLYYCLCIIGDFSSQFGMFIFGIRCAKLWIIIIKKIVRDWRAGLRFSGGNLWKNAGFPRLCMLVWALGYRNTRLDASRVIDISHFFFFQRQSQGRLDISHDYRGLPCYIFMDGNSRGDIYI